MSASSLLKFFGRLVILGALVMALWFLFFVEKPSQGSEAGKKAEMAKNGQEFNGEGGKPNATNGPSGESSSDKSKTDADSGQSGHGRHLRTLQVIHLHLPEDGSSRELSDSLAEIRMSWPDHLIISTINVSSKPQILADWRVSSAPAVVFQTEGKRLYSMEGLWPKDRLAKKIEALIHGLVEVDKNWRPEVKGLERR